MGVSVASAARAAAPCEQHRVDTLLDVRICRELDFDVCTPTAATDDAAIVERYTELIRELPYVDLQCVSAWVMVRCSAAFHWQLAAPARTVCRRTCNEFRRACLPYRIVADDDECGRGAYNGTRRRNCEDYASFVEGRCYEIDDDDRRHFFLHTNSAASSPETESSITLIGCILLVYVLWNKLPL
jgi:hypothetical protein